MIFGQSLSSVGVCRHEACLSVCLSIISGSVCVRACACVCVCACVHVCTCVNPVLSLAYNTFHLPYDLIESVSVLR